MDRGQPRPAEDHWQVVEEDERPAVPVADQYPGCTIMTTLSPDGAVVSSTPSVSSEKFKSSLLSSPDVQGLLSDISSGKVRVMAVVGPVASGKTALLHSVWRRLEGTDPAGVLSPPAWDPRRAVVSQFRGPREAVDFLGRVGLNTVPSWAKPHHILSTGERFRADLARRLMLASSVGDGQQERLLLVDDFAGNLDKTTAVSCACSLAAQAKKRRAGTIVALARADLVKWIQPDAVVWLPEGVVEHNPHAGARPRVTVEATVTVGSEDSEPLWEIPARPDMAKEGDAVAGLAVKGAEWCGGTSGGTVLMTEMEKDDTVEQVCDALFDLRFDGRCLFRVPNIPDHLGSYNIGFISGPSGSAKSAIMKIHFGGCGTAKVEFVDGGTVRDAVGLLDVKARMDAVGLSHALMDRKTDELSAQEGRLVRIAALLGRNDGGVIVIDEFTSHMDQRSALILSNGVCRYARAHGLKVVVVACRADIMTRAGLQPDWHYDTASRVCTWFQVDGSSDPGEFIAKPNRHPDVWQIPTVDAVIRECDRSVWERFKEYHYKTQDLSKLARCFVMLASVNGGRMDPVGFVATIRQNGKKPENGVCPCRAHRTVVLPEWQGLGLGSRLSDGVGEIHRCEGAEYYGQTVHPTFGAYRDRCPLWEATQWNHDVNQFRIENWSQRLENVRVQVRVPKLIYSHKYRGPRHSPEAERFYQERGMNIRVENRIPPQGYRLHRWRHANEFRSPPKPHSAPTIPTSKSRAKQLEDEAELLYDRIAGAHGALKEGRINEAEFCCVYLLLYSWARHGAKWLGGPIPGGSLNAGTKKEAYCQWCERNPLGKGGMLVSDMPWLPQPEGTKQMERLSGLNAVEVIARYQIQGVREYVNMSLVEWAAGRRPLKLVHGIPSVARLLHMQAEGYRCVSAFLRRDQLMRVVDDRDAMEFLVHDLKHMENFVSQGYEEQVGLLWALQEADPKLRTLLESGVPRGHDEECLGSVDYVRADMNSNAAHMLSMLKGKVIAGHCRLLAESAGEDLPSADERASRHLSDKEQESVTRLWDEISKALGMDPSVRMLERAFVASAHLCSDRRKDKERDELEVRRFFKNRGLRRLAELRKSSPVPPQPDQGTNVRASALPGSPSLCGTPSEECLGAVMERCQAADQGQVRSEISVTTRGYVVARREYSAKLLFMELAEDKDGPPRLQVCLNTKWCGGCKDVEKEMRELAGSGDLLIVAGHPGRTRTGTGAGAGATLFVTSGMVTSLALSGGRIVTVMEMLKDGRMERERAASLLRVDVSGIDAWKEVASSMVEAKAEADRLAREGVAAAVAERAEGSRTALSQSRTERLETAVKSRQRDLYVVVENPARASNVGAILRSCDAFAVTQALFIFPPDGKAPFDLAGEDVLHTSVSAARWADVLTFESVESCVAYLRTRGEIRSVGTAVHSGRSHSLYEIDLVGSFEKGGVAVWLGNEAKGLTDAALDACEQHVYVPMLGLVESLNIAVCGGVLLAEVQRQRQAAMRSHGADFSLSPEEQDRLFHELATRAASGTS